MDEGEVIVRQILSETSSGQKVGSVGSICEATGLSTGGAIAVMKRLIDQGLVRSERGPKGGYWRTAAPVPAAGTHDELHEIAKALESITARVNALIVDMDANV